MCKNDSLISRGDLYWALLSDVDTSKSADDKDTNNWCLFMYQEQKKKLDCLFILLYYLNK